MNQAAQSSVRKKAATAFPQGRTVVGKPTPIDHLNALVYRGTDDNGKDRWQRYFEPVPQLSLGLPVPILGIMVLIWQLRGEDLQAKYSLKTRDSRLRFIGWCAVHGRKEYRSLQQATKLWDALNQPADLFGTQLSEHDPANAFSWLMVLAADARPDLKIDLETKDGRERLLAWYLLHGRVELGFDDTPLEEWQVHYLFSPSATPGLNRLQELVYRARPDVREAFPLPSSKQEYIAWFRNFITVETRLIDALRSKSIVLEEQYESRDRAVLPFGVNVIGYVYGQLGIGEDARMAAKSLLTTDIPMTMLDFPPGAGVSQEDRSMASFVGVESKYSVNMFCLTALEHGRCFAERGIDGIRGRYNIGYWPWELPRWPEQWKHLLALVDEVWVSTRYTHDSVAPYSPVPVRIMQMAVEAAYVSEMTREDFGLPSNAKLFMFAFDFNSTAKRKNPEACVRTFLKAFPADGKRSLGVDDVGLVIKVHPPKSRNKDWERLKSLQKKDPRIHLIAKTLSTPDLLALYSVCDCFVSLHRAEGFGRCIAEAMLLGKPVIATGYSGNLEFTNEKNAFLTRFKPLPLNEGDYPYGKGQSWVEPDISHASRQMRQIVNNPALAVQLGRHGRATILRRHNFNSAGFAMSKSLRRIMHTGLLSKGT